MKPGLKIGLGAGLAILGTLAGLFGPQLFAQGQNDLVVKKQQEELNKLNQQYETKNKGFTNEATNN